MGRAEGTSDVRASAISLPKPTEIGMHACTWMLMRADRRSYDPQHAGTRLIHGFLVCGRISADFGKSSFRVSMIKWERYYA
jgi:hypothetical protein